MDVGLFIQLVFAVSLYGVRGPVGMSAVSGQGGCPTSRFEWWYKAIYGGSNTDRVEDRVKNRVKNRVGGLSLAYELVAALLFAGMGILSKKAFRIIKEKLQTAMQMHDASPQTAAYLAGISASIFRDLLSGNDFHGGPVEALSELDSAFREIGVDFARHPGQSSAELAACLYAKFVEGIAAEDRNKLANSKALLSAVISLADSYFDLDSWLERAFASTIYGDQPSAL